MNLTSNYSTFFCCEHSSKLSDDHRYMDFCRWGRRSTVVAVAVTVAMAVAVTVAAIAGLSESLGLGLGISRPLAVAAMAVASVAVAAMAVASVAVATISVAGLGGHGGNEDSEGDLQVGIKEADQVFCSQSKVLLGLLTKHFMVVAVLSY